MLRLITDSDDIVEIPPKNIDALIFFCLPFNVSFLVDPNHDAGSAMRHRKLRF